MEPKKRLLYMLSFVGILAVVALVFFLRTSHRRFFQKTTSGLQYQVVNRGDGLTPQRGDMLMLNVCYKTEKGVVIFDTTDHELPMAIPYSEEGEKKDGGFEEAVSMLRKGDTILFKMNAEKVFGESLDYVTTQYGLTKGMKVLVNLQLQNIMNKEAYRKWATDREATMKKQKQEKEQIQLKEDINVITDYLKQNSIEAQVTSAGVHYVIDKPGQGKKPKQGDKVKVHYTGYLLDGKVFDTSLADVAKQHGIHNPQKMYEAIEFQLGTGQVIQGWEEGIMYLRQGDQARLFIPSTLAYGSQRMGNGLIPTNAILTFEVELVDVLQC